MSETIKDVFASVVGSTACVYTGQPFDTVKVRMQVQGDAFGGTIACIRKTVTNEGLLALWKGSLPAVMGAVSENAMAFGTNGLLKRFFNIDPDSNTGMNSGDSNGGIDVVTPIFTGAITGACTAVVLCPSDTLKCRAQVAIAKGNNITLRQLMKHVYKTHGLRGFYSGFCAQIMRDIPFYSSFFGTYEILCQTFRKYTAWDQSSIYFISGGLAGQVGWAVSIAPDSVKSKIQTHDHKLYILDTARSIYRTQGIRGFFVGIEVAILRAFPANAALFVGYEYSRKFMNHYI